jgi:hypothetical protein
MDYQQQDSQEFLRFLLDGMSEDLCRKHSELAPATAVSASISNASASVTSPASVRQSSILPILPGTPLGGGAAPDFSRTAPAGSVELDLQVKHILVSNSASTSPMTVNARAHASASQRLREETRAMRQEGLAIDVPTSATAQLPRLRNNNQGEEGAVSAATPANAANSNTESHSKYVSRMRNRSEQGREDTATPVSVRKDISSDRIAPFSPILASGEKASKADALMRSADDYEDFSGGEGELFYHVSLRLFAYDVLYYVALQIPAPLPLRAKTRQPSSRAASVMPPRQTIGTVGCAKPRHGAAVAWTRTLPTPLLPGLTPCSSRSLPWATHHRPRAWRRRKRRSRGASI